MFGFPDAGVDVPVTVQIARKGRIAAADVKISHEVAAVRYSRQSCDSINQNKAKIRNDMAAAFWESSKIRRINGNQHPFTPNDTRFQNAR